MTDAPPATGVAWSYGTINAINVPRAPPEAPQVGHISPPTTPTAAVHAHRALGGVRDGSGGPRGCAGTNNKGFVALNARLRSPRQSEENCRSPNSFRRFGIPNVFSLCSHPAAETQRRPQMFPAAPLCPVVA